MERMDYVRAILGDAYAAAAQHEEAEVFMPSNIALVKYWGKRPGVLNLPLVSSLSLTLKGYGTKTRLSLSHEDSMLLNGKTLSQGDPAYKKAMDFLDMFRARGECYRIETENNIPTAAGVASSASGFAALTSAIIKLKGWDVPLKAQSMLARLGSGSAARSFWDGMVLWHKGTRDDGMDCYAEPVTHSVHDLCLSVLVLDASEKSVSSRDAMQASLATSPMAPEWPQRQAAHLDAALKAADFATLGQIVEDNAVLMHAVIQSAVPAMSFDTAETKKWKDNVQRWRTEGMPVYFTQDAGAQIKLLYPSAHRADIEEKINAAGVEYFTVAA